jgi:hypothetical protein
MQPIAQGEVYITRINSIPAGAMPREPEGGRYVLGHSETGHHHVVSAATTQVLEPPATERIPEAIRQLYLIVREPTRFVHLRQDDNHAAHTLEPGCYRVRSAREGAFDVPAPAEIRQPAWLSVEPMLTQRARWVMD